MAAVVSFILWAALIVGGAIVGIMVAIKLLKFIWAVLRDVTGIIFAVILVVLFLVFLSFFL